MKIIPVKKCSARQFRQSTADLRFAGTGNSPSQPKLLDQVRDQLRLRHYSIRTEAQYIHSVKRFILFHHKRHPREMAATEVEAFPYAQLMGHFSYAV